MDRGIDPYDVSSDEYGDLVENRILMAVDKYQAAVARSQKAHDEAMDIVKGTLFPKYRNDVIMNRVLTAVDAVGKEETLFAEAA